MIVTIGPSPLFNLYYQDPILRTFYPLFTSFRLTHQSFFHYGEETNIAWTCRTEFLVLPLVLCFVRPFVFLCSIDRIETNGSSFVVFSLSSTATLYNRPTQTFFNWHCRFSRNLATLTTYGTTEIRPFDGLRFESASEFTFSSFIFSFPSRIMGVSFHFTLPFSLACPGGIVALIHRWSFTCRLLATSVSCWAIKPVKGGGWAVNEYSGIERWYTDSEWFSACRNLVFSPLFVH